MSPRPPEEIDQTTYAGRFGAALRARRVRRKMEVSEVAALVGVSPPTWYHWEAGRHSPLIEHLPKIAAALRCPVRSLLPAE